MKITEEIEDKNKRQQNKVKFFLKKLNNLKNKTRKHGIQKGLAPREV